MYSDHDETSPSSVDRTLGGKEFQERAAATGNARSPRVDRRVDGMTSDDVLADLSIHFDG